MSSFVHRVLVVDDEPMVCELVRAILASESDLELVGVAVDGVKAIDLTSMHQPDVVVMDVDMPCLDGPRATERILQEHPSTRVLAHTGHVDSERVTSMIVAGAVGYVVKGEDPKRLCAAIRQAAARRPHVDPQALPGLFSSVVALAREERTRRREAERLARELEVTFRETVSGLMCALESRDGYTGGHDDRVGELAVSVGKELGLAGQELRDVEYGALFHDIGKIAMPDSILRGTKKGLSDEEWAIIRDHTVVGERIIQPIGFLHNAARIVRGSHEHWDGSGYPDGLCGRDIPLASRIVLACDAFDAMTSGRTYQAAVTADEAVGQLRRLSGTHFDPDVVAALERVVRSEGGPGAAGRQRAREAVAPSAVPAAAADPLPTQVPGPAARAVMGPQQA